MLHGEFGVLNFTLIDRKVVAQITGLGYVTCRGFLYSEIQDICYNETFTKCDGNFGIVVYTIC